MEMVEKKTSKSPLPHKSNKNTGKKKEKKSIKINSFTTLEINQRLATIAGHYRNNLKQPEKKTNLNLGKDSKLYGVFTCLNFIPLSPTLL